MSLWRSILRWLGIYREARVQITAPGIEVTLAGEPSQVRALMGVIRTELERKARRDRRMNTVDSSQVVRPSELDEMDSPYALPEAVVVPVPEEERAEERRARLIAMPAPKTGWPGAPPPVSAQAVPYPPVAEPEDSFGAEDESVQTALTAHPGDAPTPPIAEGVRAVTPAEIDTLEVDRRKSSGPDSAKPTSRPMTLPDKRGPTRPLPPFVNPDG